MKEIFDSMREKIRSYSYEVETLGGKDIEILDTENALEVIAKAEAKWKEDCCEWKWGIDYAQVQCRGDKILFESRRLFTYCPYCGKTIAEVE